jgi:hypothetical protein
MKNAIQLILMILTLLGFICYLGYLSSQSSEFIEKCIAQEATPQFGHGAAKCIKKDGLIEVN